MKIKLEEKFNNYYKNLESSLTEALTPQLLLDNFYRNNGFDSNGEGLIILGNTYSIKELLKALDGKFNGTLKRWVVPADKIADPLILQQTYYKVHAGDLFDKNSASGVYDYRLPNVQPHVTTDIIALEKQMTQNTSNSTLQSALFTPRYSIGDVAVVNTISVTLKTSKPSAYGTTYVYEIIGQDGNYVWYASNDLGNTSDITTVTGRVKGYTNFRGTDYTVLTRCRIQRTLQNLQTMLPLSSMPQSTKINSVNISLGNEVRRFKPKLTRKL